MLKPYHSKDNPTTCRPVANVVSISDCPPDDSVNPSYPVEKSMKLHTSDVLLNLDRKLNHSQKTKPQPQPCKPETMYLPFAGMWLGYFYPKGALPYIDTIHLVSQILRSLLLTK